MKEREQIKAIREEYSGLMELPRESLLNSVKTLADDLYTKDTHFIFELIQNAEDNDYKPGVRPRLRFEICLQEIEGRQDIVLSVHNNEVGFLEKHVRAICQVGCSTKNKAQGYIGEKGIGFKSVFRVTTSPYVFSNGFKFCLPEHDEKTGLGYIVPQWVEKRPVTVAEKETAIILPFNKDKSDVRSVSKALKEIAPETILFLQKLTSLDISIRLPESEYEVIAEKKILRQSGASKLVELSYMQHGGNIAEEVIETACYWLTEHEFQKPPEVQHEKRLGIETRTVSVAIPLNQEIHEGKLFAYLPVWEQTGLPFFVNADFLLVSSREGIKEDEGWNLWLRDCVAETYTTAFLSLLGDQQLPFETQVSAYASIPLISHHQFLKPVVDTIRERLANLDCVLTLPDSVPVKPEQARLCYKNLRAVFGLPQHYPNYLRENALLVSPEIELFSEQLKAIGVKRFLLSDVLTCFKDTVWVQSHPLTWFIELFRFLKGQNFKPEDLYHLYIVPVSHEKQKAPQFSCVEEQPIYFPAVPKESEALANTPQWLSSLVVVAFVHPDFLVEVDRQTDCDDLKKWMAKELAIYPFSIANYCVDILSGISDGYEHITEEQLIEATRFLFQNDEMKKSGWDDLPIILADERKMLLKEVRRLRIPESEMLIDAIVVPESYDPLSGWQHIWPTVEDRVHFVALSNHYASMPKGWFHSLNIKYYPMFRTISYGWSAVPDYMKEEKDMARMCIHRSANGRGSEVQITSYAIPSSMNYDSCEHEFSRALLNLFKTFSEYHPRLQAKGTYQYRGTKWLNCDSVLLKKLRCIGWLPTTKGLVAPCSAFLPKVGIEEVLGDTVAYFNEDLRESILKMLEVKSGISIDGLIEILKNNSQKSVDPSLPTRIYTELSNRSHNNANKIRLAFSDATLIFCNDGCQCGRWCRNDECVWEEATEVLGDDFIYLEQQYPKLKDFFVETLGIMERVDAECFARRLVTLQKSPLADLEQQRHLVEKIYRQLKSLTQRPEHERPAWWKSFFEEVKLYSKSDTFCDPVDLILPDDGELRQIFKGRDNVEFVWRPRDDAFNDWAPFYRTFNVPLLSESVTEHLEECLAPEYLKKNRLVTVACVQMIAARLREKSREDYDRLLANGIFQQLLSVREATTAEMIRVEYRLETKAYKYDPISEDYSVFWDRLENIIYYTTNLKKNQFAKALTKGLLKHYKDLEPWVELVLEAEDTKRLRDDNYSVPKEILDLCNQEVGSDSNQATGSPMQVDEKMTDNSSSFVQDKIPKQGKAEISKPLSPASRDNQQAESKQDFGDGVAGKKADANTPSLNTNQASTIAAEGKTVNKPNEKKHDQEECLENDQSARGKQPLVNFLNEISKAFNKDGETEINPDLTVSDEGSVKNPARRGQKLTDNLCDDIDNEPSPKDRHNTTERSLLEGPGEAVRSSLFEWYRGKCQICGKTWPKRNGEPFFVAAYLVDRRNARWLDKPGNALCLCAEHFAQWRYAAKVLAEDVTTQLGKLRLKAEGGSGDLLIKFRMLNEDCAIYYDERHFLELRILLDVTRKIEADYAVSN